MNILVKIFTFVLLFHSCSHMKSGQNIFWSKNESLEKISEKNDVSVADIKKFNPEARPGDWLFVPNQVGWISFFQDTTVEENYSSLGSGEFLWPAPGLKKISSSYGPRGGKHHDGIDIPGPVGSKIVAVKEGKVIYADRKISGYGNMIIIEHENKIFSLYAHNKRNLVKKGERVKRGQKIALLGNTGRSTGPHLHFEIRYKSKARNPAQYLR